MTLKQLTFFGHGLDDDMKRILISVAAFLISIFAFCQDRYMNAYAKFSGKVNKDVVGKLDINKRGRLVLYLGSKSIEVYPEEWTVSSDLYIIIGNEKFKISRKQRDSYGSYLLINKEGEKYYVTFRGGDFIRINANASEKANEYFLKYSSPSHAAHTSHFSGHNSHVSHYSANK